MDNQARLHAMRWSAATRLQLRKGDKWDLHRARLLMRMVDHELDMLEHGFEPRDASGIVLACDMQVAFDRLASDSPTLAEDNRDRM